MVADLAQLVGSHPEDRRIDASIQQLFDNLLLIDGSFQGPIGDMVDRIQQFMAAALRGA
jgi:hypothetical protein